MSLKVYGRSDDLIEFDGDISDEISTYLSQDAEEECKRKLAFSDGSLFTVTYGVGDGAFWRFTPIHLGNLFDHKEEATDDEKEYSDILYFKDGIKWALMGYELVK